MDKLGIINQALMKCGLPLAASLADCDWNASEAYPVVVEKMLRGYDWGFAQRVAQLVELPNELAFGYRHVFALPEDWVRTIDVRRVFDLRAPCIQGKRMGKTFCANSRPCNMRYVAWTDESEWPLDFCMAAASGIAAQIAGLSAEKMNLVPSLLQMHQLELAEAQANDARECFERMPQDLSIWNVRQRSGGGE